jgi:hypothetical protein
MTDTEKTAPKASASSVRFTDRDEGIIAGLIVPYNGPLPGDKDLLGTRFSSKTDLALDWFPDGGRPGLYAHGFDEELEMEVIGREVRSYETDKGIWMEAQLDKAHRYAGEIMELLDKGALALSSGSIDHLVKLNKSTRDMERWPWVEWSLVPNPGNPEALIYQVRSTDAIKHAPEAAIRIVSDLEALVAEDDPTVDHEPVEVEPPAGDAIAFTGKTTEAVRSLIQSLEPVVLHDLSIEMGASCPTREAEVPEPTPTFSIRADIADVVPVTDDDLAAYRESFKALAISTVNEHLDK